MGLLKFFKGGEKKEESVIVKFYNKRNRALKALQEISDELATVNEEIIEAIDEAQVSAKILREQSSSFDGDIKALKSIHNNNVSSINKIENLL